MHPTAGQYNDNQRAACQSVLVEVIHLLGDYVDHIAIIGGWVPSLLLPATEEKHVGTMDVDVALDRKGITEEAYSTIHKILTRSGYSQSTEKGAQFKYLRRVTVNGQSLTVEVDLITAEYGGETGRRRRHERVQDVMALKARGADLVFGRTKTVPVTADLPDDAGKDTVVCQIAGVVPFIVMKGIVLVRRKKHKDAYDLVFVLRNFPGGTQAIAELVRPDIKNTLVQEALENIRQKFSTPDDYGPAAVTTFLEIENRVQRDILRRQVFQTVQQFLETLKALQP